LNDNRYAIKNAALFTAIIAIILIAPLYTYTLYMKKIYEIQNELKLKQRSATIISAMEAFDSNKAAYFEYPRFKELTSGLYNLHFKPIFTLINQPIKHFSAGYHIESNNLSYLILPLPHGRYFEADYLIIANTISFAPIYERVFSVLIAIIIIIFLLSLLFLHRFAQPFKQVNERLDNFIKDSVHEINTPLSIINVNIDLFNRKHESSKYLQRIKAATKTLSNIYNDMEYLIKNKTLSQERERINFSTFLRERIFYFKEIAAMQSITIAGEVDEGLFITFNPVQLQRIIDNNLSNAIKYSHEYSIVTVTLHSNKKGCVLQFQDYGIGIEDTQMIFERYYREESGKAGFGIGLNIVKSILDEYHITLQVNSAPQRGSTFTYTFPKTLC